MTLGANYATLAELKTRVATGNETAMSTTYDSRLNDCLATASRSIEKACGRQFNDAGSVSAREYEPCDTWWLDVDDFNTTTGLVVKQDTAADGTFATTLAATTYKAYPLNGISDGETGWPFWRLMSINYRWPTYWQLPPIQVTARWGWTAVPAGVKEGCLILAEELFKASDTPFGSGGYGQFGIINARENPMCWRLIQRYARNRIMVA